MSYYQYGFRYRLIVYNSQPKAATYIDSTSDSFKRAGLSVRFVSDATGVPDGTKTTYTGNDGKLYEAVAINGLYWLSENLAETKYRNGDVIPEVTDNTTWTNLTSGALSAYDNNWNYVGRPKPDYY